METMGINGLDTVWVLLAAMLVFFMQPGFALVEAGFTRSKNTANILMKNFVDFMLGSVLFWAVGFGLMHAAGNGFIGRLHLFDYSFFPGYEHPFRVYADFPDDVLRYGGDHRFRRDGGTDEVLDVYRVLHPDFRTDLSD